MLLFGDFRFNPHTCELWRNGTPVPLERQPAMILGRLLAADGQTVTRDELALLLWGPSGTHVNFADGLNYCIRQIRIALQDEARTPRFVLTIPRRGYRFTSPVVHHDDIAKAARERRRLTWAGIGLAAGVLLLVLEVRPNNHHQIAVDLLRTTHNLIF